ncbi:CBF-domain-containing protein [Dothidotthia symphoricarpi CBS 119687]|uniref:CBF-domain-containing protein n=1 Tax=Dothidotthia symphoricarpi CBS 119687 TaxID=1392245 RepID=A0A6A6APS5_9PLEO|nr:CBF-domain-containing protein [Dothidotthia symphoricarpi CBS 119687]KAF2132877.1 CBF-domain-containing protein [Dothidotthia symphoricarpi CBS 119687]
MPGTKSASLAGAKRKRDPSKPERREHKSKSRRKSPSDHGDDAQSDILHLEAQILESRRHYNNIATLLQLAKQPDAENEAPILAVVALCRVFSRLLATGDMVKSKGMGEAEAVIVSWLKERYKDLLDVLLDDFLRSDQPAKQSVALALVMRLVKEESKAQKDYNIKNGPLSRLVEVLLLLPQDDLNRDEFAEKYFKQFDDVRYHTFQTIKNVLSTDIEASTKQLVAANSLALLSTIDTVPTSDDDISNLYTESLAKSPIPSLKAYKSKAQEAWLATMRSGLNKEQRKTILTAFSYQIAPWFQQPEMLMDFLTDSYNVGGATSLLALSGLYYLISSKNLDYPSFYLKLYSLLDDSLLHSKHRSRFFRLLDTFMSSTHLPAALVASFMKRLSRLALHGPPAGIVVVIPWIYNMFKRHPACTYMMHRETRSPALLAQLEESGMDDPFDMDQLDPVLSHAIDSSVWELEALQAHYHPNVATLAKIIAEQFTKRSYNLEDFLDHSYTALLDIELNRDLKKDPEVEFEIQKHIFTAPEAGADGGLNPLGQLLAQVIAAR